MAPKKKKVTPRKRVRPAPDRLAGLEQRMRELADRLTGVQLSLVRHNERIQDAEDRITNGEKNVKFLSRADAASRVRLAKLEMPQCEAMRTDHIVTARDKVVAVRNKLANLRMLLESIIVNDLG